MTVYLDTLMVLNFLMDYLILLLTGRVVGSPLPRGRIALAALLGAGYAAAVFYPGVSFLALPAVRIAAGVGMVLIAYGARRHLFRILIVFFALSAAFGGGLYALSLLRWGVTTYSGFFVPVLDLKRILFYAAALYFVLSLFCRKFARHSHFEGRDMVLHLEGRKVRLRALLDSGNTLSDPISGKSVPVVDAKAVAEVLPPDADPANPTECFPRLKPPGRFALLPYRSVGVERGLLLAMRVDAIEVNGKTISSDLVALSPNAVSETGQYQALLGQE